MTSNDTTSNDVTPRELVKQTLEFKNPSRVPRQMWTLPWAGMYHGEELKEIQTSFPDDIVMAFLPGAVTCECFTARPGDPKGEPYELGTYLDVWGCTFTIKHRGVIGETKGSLIADEEWEDDHKFKTPEIALKIDKAAVNEFCASTDKFVLSGDLVRPFERLQFLRGTEALYMDLALRPKRMFKNFEKIHDFYCRLLTSWCETDVDGVWCTDDWGSQRALLINPALWVEFFKPMYKDYVEIAHKYGKKFMMHSDGYILDIYPHFIDMGVDAINSQIFCMGVDKLAQYKNHITFWGEVDRQYLLPHGTAQEITDAVRLMRYKLWKNGGYIAQCEFGPGARPENVRKVFEIWDEDMAR